MKYVAILDEEYTRDMQFLTNPDSDPHDDDSWKDWGGSGSPRVFLGIYQGSATDAKETAAQEHGLDVRAISLIPVG